MGDAFVGKQARGLLVDAVGLAVEPFGFAGGLFRRLPGQAQGGLGVGGFGAGAVQAVDDQALLLRGAAQRRRAIEDLGGIPCALERGREGVALAHGGAGHFVEGALGSPKIVAGDVEDLLGVVDGAAGAFGLGARGLEVDVGPVGVFAQPAHVQLEFGNPALVLRDVGDEGLQDPVRGRLGVRVAAGRLRRHGGCVSGQQTDHHGSGNGAGPPEAGPRRPANCHLRLLAMRFGPTARIRWQLPHCPNPVPPTRGGAATGLCMSRGQQAHPG